MNVAVTPEERASVGEVYFLACYPIGILAVIGACAVAAAVAGVDQGATAGSSLAVIGALAVAAALSGRSATTRRGCYEALRGRGYLLAVPALLTIPIARLWPSVDQNALYFAVAGPMAIIVCVAQRAIDGFTGIVLIAAATAVASALDTAHPALGGIQAQSTATLGVILIAMFLKIIVQWGALVTQESARATESPLSEGLPSAMPAADVHRLAMRRAGGRLTALAAVVADELGGAAAELTAWRDAIVALFASPNARSRMWRLISGFPARELQVLLLLHRYNEFEVARLLSISVRTVRNTAFKAVRSERTRPDGAVLAAGTVTRAALSRELAEEYPTALEIDELARVVGEAIETRNAGPAQPESV